MGRKSKSMIFAPETRYHSISSDHYAQFKPNQLGFLKKTVEDKGKYKSIHGIAAISVISLLNKAIGIVENTEEYTEYLLLNTFGDKSSYNKVPPGTIRIFNPNLVCFFNGRTWRKLK
tara:strand:- start:271 stop:621 length:351 start_codon:yes stop_codon:yes gene_type:complete